VNRALHEATVQAFEELAFVFPMPELEPPEHRPSTAATIDFEGGRLVLVVSDDLLPVIAANMLGDEEPSREDQLDALREVVNVICGNVLPAIGAGGMGTPRLGGDEGGTPAAQANVLLSDGSASVRLFLK
jgi:hypothetical protein